MKAFILIKSRPGMEDRLAELILEESRVQRVFKTFGPYDLLAEIECSSTSELEEIVSYIRKLPDVVDTITLISAREMKSRE